MHAFIKGLLEVCRDASKIGQTTTAIPSMQTRHSAHYKVLGAKNVCHCDTLEVAWKYLNAHLTPEHSMVHLLWVPKVQYVC